MIISLIKALAAVHVDPGDLQIPNQGGTSSDTLPNILKIVFALAGAISVLIVTIGGFRYVISQGNPQETAKAKDTIIYAIIGLVVCIFAFVITGFVANNL